MKKTPSRTQLPDQRDGQAPATRRLAAVLCLSLLLSGCAHGAVARTGGPPGAEAVRDVKRCPGDGEQVELPAHSVFHLPTDAVRKAWREALGSDAEGGAIEELAVHLGAPPAEMVAAVAHAITIPFAPMGVEGFALRYGSSSENERYAFPLVV